MASQYELVSEGALSDPHRRFATHDKQRRKEVRHTYHMSHTHTHYTHARTHAHTHSAASDPIIVIAGLFTLNTNYRIDRLLDLATLCYASPK